MLLPTVTLCLRMNRFIRIIGLATICMVLALPAAAEPKYASIVVDARTGMVLEAQQAESLRHPASLTKLMTLYLTFKALKNGTLRMNEAIPVSEYAAAQAPSKLGLRPGTTIRVRDAILGLVTQSANDAAVTLGEALGGSEANFAGQMTRQARRLGMSRTVYRNASGLPDDDQVTTARDQAILARALLFNFPEYYPLFRTTRFTYLGLTHDNHNHLMRRYPGMDGMKTGYIRASGFNLVASAVRGKTRLIGVVFGGESARARDRDMAGLLNKTFAWVERNSSKLSGSKATPIPADQPDDEDQTAPAATPVATNTGPDTPPSQPATAPAANDVATPPVAAASAAPPTASSIIAEGDGIDEEAAEAANRPPAPGPQSTHADNGVVPTAAPPPVAEAASQPRANAAAFPTKQPTPVVAKSLTAPPAVKSSKWTVQIGAYRNRSSSEQAVRKLGQHLPKHLAKAHYEIVEVKNGGIMMYRARLVGLDEKAARGICRSLAKTGRKCSLIPPAA